MTATPIAVSDTAQLGDTIVRLQGLVEAYSAILEQAKLQLEQLELTPDQLRELERRVGDNFSYKPMASDFARQITEGQHYTQDSYYQPFNELVDAITKRVTEKIADVTLSRFRNEINSLFQQELIDARKSFKEWTDSHLQRAEYMELCKLQNENRSCRSALRRVLDLAYDSNELNQMAAAALPQANADTPATETHA